MIGIERLDPYALADALEQCNANETCRGCKYISMDCNCVSKLMAAAADVIRKQADELQESDYSRMMNA